jgi:hypothetical protein
MSDEITLTIPPTREFHRVAHLVLGGLAVRLDLTIEALEDLGLAVDAVLARVEPADADAMTVRMLLGDGTLETVIGPLQPALLDEIEQEPGDALGLRRVLDGTVDEVVVNGDFVRLVKQVVDRG